MIKKIISYQSLLFRIWDAQSMKYVFPIIFSICILIGFLNGTFSDLKGPIFIFLVVYFVYKLYVGNTTIHLVPVSRQFEAVNMYLSGIFLVIILYFGFMLLIAMFVLAILIVTFLAGVLEFGGESMITSEIGAESFGYIVSYCTSLLFIYVSAISTIILVKKRTKCILLLVGLLCASFVLVYAWLQLPEECYIAFALILSIGIIAIPAAVLRYINKETKIITHN